MKKSLIHNLAYLLIGSLVMTGLSVACADSFTGPTATAPGNNIPAPLHTGPDQVKDGGLSVNGFIANQNAAFEQEVFLNGTILGGSPTGTQTSSTITIGDQNTPANIAVSGSLSAQSYLQSASVANTSNLSLCANAEGVIVTCSGTSSYDDPTITQVGPTTTANGEDEQIFAIGPTVNAGDTYSMGVYSHEVTVTAAAGDDATSIVEKLVAAINSTTAAQWNEGTDIGGAPAPGTPGFPPVAQSSPSNGQWIIVFLNQTSQFGASASSASSQ